MRHEVAATEMDLKIARDGIDIQWRAATSTEAFLEHQAQVLAQKEAQLRVYANIINKDLNT